MASISAQDVKTLRESTGAGMMDCKKVLTEADGDPQKALELLRERGLSKAGKRAGRETSEGTIAIAIEGTTSVMIELGCETDFVAKTEDFQGLANEIATAIVNDGSAANVEQAQALKAGDETIEARVTNAAATMGENISLKRVERVASDTVVGSYIHMGGKLGVVVALSGGADGADADYASVAKDVAMHIAAIDPTPRLFPPTLSKARRQFCEIRRCKVASPRTSSTRSSKAASTSSMQRTACSSRRS